MVDSIQSIHKHTTTTTGVLRVIEGYRQTHRTSIIKNQSTVLIWWLHHHSVCCLCLIQMNLTQTEWETRCDWRCQSVHLSVSLACEWTPRWLIGGREWMTASYINKQLLLYDDDVADDDASYKNNLRKFELSVRTRQSTPTVGQI